MLEIAIIITLVILLILADKFKESFVRSTADPKGSFVRLYSKFGQEGDLYEFAEDSSTTNFIKKVIKINPQSMDINLTNTPTDVIRRVDIWEMNDNMPNASLSTDFYNIYLNPEYVYRANPAQIRKIISVAPGQRVIADFPDPVQKIMLIAQL